MVEPPPPISPWKNYYMHVIQYRTQPPHPQPMLANFSWNRGFLLLKKCIGKMYTWYNWEKPAFNLNRCKYLIVSFTIQQIHAGMHDGIEQRAAIYFAKEFIKCLAVISENTNKENCFEIWHFHSKEIFHSPFQNFILSSSSTSTSIISSFDLSINKFVGRKYWHRFPQ